MTIMEQQPTGSRVLRSPSWARAQRACTRPCEDGLWSSTFVEMSSSPGLRDVVAHFSGALDPCGWDQVRVEVFKSLDGQMNLPGSALWLTMPYTFIDTVLSDEQQVDETVDVLDAFERIRAELGLTQKEMFKATGINKRTFHSWAAKPRQPAPCSQLGWTVGVGGRRRRPPQHTGPADEQVAACRQEASLRTTRRPVRRPR